MNTIQQAGVIFDGDDTLWETSIFYKEAKEEFFHEMADLGFNYKEVEEFFNKTDLANVAKFGFTKKRFPTSMAETYRAFCKRYSYKNENDTERKLTTIGNGVFQRKPILLGHADSVLKKLQPHYKLILATKGDLEVQKAKISHSGLGSFFERIYILEHKTEREMQRIVDENQLDIGRSWKIGNSLKSDINPALNIGLKAIWIPYHYTWAYEEAETQESSNFHKASSLEEALKFLL